MIKECESATEAAGLNATILRPWYVLGPGALVGRIFCCPFTNSQNCCHRCATEPNGWD